MVQGPGHEQHTLGPIDHEEYRDFLNEPVSFNLGPKLWRIGDAIVSAVRRVQDGSLAARRRRFVAHMACGGTGAVTAVSPYYVSANPHVIGLPGGGDFGLHRFGEYRAVPIPVGGPDIPPPTIPQERAA